MFATVFAVGLVAAFSSNSADASAAEDYEENKDAHYYYNGHTGYNQDGAFIMDQQFIDGLANNNFTLNDYWINAHPDANDVHSHTFEVYDQTLYVNTDNQVYRASFPINNHLSDLYATIATIENAYGEPDESTLWYGDGEYSYVLDNAQITFTFDAGLVTHVHVGSKEIE